MSDLTRLLCMLGEREERRARLQTFAEMTRADTALVLFRDVELDILLPMPDTPTLASGPGWTELFESCRAPGLRSLSLPLGLDGSPRSTCILVAGNGTALVLIGSSRELEASLGAELAPALGLLGTCLREEQKSTASRAREKVADAYASTSNALTAALDRSRDELRTSLGETARLNRLLEEANHRKDRFLAILSHELRNPVWALTAALQAMRVGGQSGDNAVRLERQVDTATRHAGQIARLLDDLLDISRITQDKFELRRTQVDLRDLILHVGRIFGAHARPKGVNFVLSTPTRPVWVVGDAARLEQVLTNLLVNAVKYTDAGGSVFLETSEDDGNVSIIVRDSGIGIAPNVLPNVFDLFVQADEARERSRGGLGIGLTLVRQLVELHGGEVMALSAGAGHGTEMRVVLPTIPASEVVIAKRRPSPMSLARAARRVLIVDDNRDAADMLCEIVQSWGHVTRAAYEGTAALREAESFLPDIALLDVGLPDISGYALAARLRQSSSARAVLIAVTGYGAASDRAKASEAGFDHHLVKPPNLEHIRFLLGAS